MSAGARAPGRPAATLLVLSFDQERFIAEAIRGAFAQTFSPLEILFSDDGSSDRTFEIIREHAAAYRGPHQVRLRRSDANLGIAENINAAVAQAAGDIIVVAAGDDVSLPQRVQRIVDAFAARPSCRSIHSNMVVVDAAGVPGGTWIQGGAAPACTLEAMVERGVGVLGASHAWRREVFDFFGPLDRRVIREDAAIPFRSALLGEIAWLDEVLVQYRRHDANVYRFRNELGPQQLRADWIRHCRGNIGVYASMANDLDAFARHRGDSPRLQALRQRVGERLAESQLEEGFAEAPSNWQRSLVMARAAARGVAPRRLARWGMLQWLPRAYLARVRRSVKAPSG